MSYFKRLSKLYSLLMKTKLDNPEKTLRKHKEAAPSARCYATIYNRIDSEKCSQSENGTHDTTLVDLY